MNEEDRPWSELSAAEQEDEMAQAAAQGGEDTEVIIAWVDPEQWPAVRGEIDGRDDYAEGVDVDRQGDAP